MDQGYYRYPTIAGDRIVFVCEDDLWSVAAEGGTATRLTASFGMCSFPRLSPDGRSIAFVSTDEGNPEVYVMPTTGGVPQRLSFLGASQAAVTGWSPDGSEIYFVANPTSWDEQTRPFAVTPASTVRELNLGHARSLGTTPENGMALGRNAADPARWKRYRGGTAGEIWIDSNGSGTFERVALPDGNPTWPMPIGDRIFFLADHEGIGNIYSCAAGGADVRRHTNEADYYARFPSTDGTRIVYTAGGEIACYDVAGDATQKLRVETHSAAPQTVRRFEDVSESLEHFAPHPDGTGLAFVSRGQAFTMPLFEGAVLHHGEGSTARTRLTEWLSDGKRFACVTDAGGYERIAVYRTDSSQQPPKFVTSGDIGRVTDLACSPAGDVIAFANHRHELCVLDLDDGKVRVLDTCPSHRIGDLAFSPDGRYLAYVWWPAQGTSIIRIAKVRSGKVHDVTSPLRVDQSPAWDPDGKYLYFISTRDFNPVYDALQFELEFSAGRPPVRRYPAQRRTLAVRSSAQADSSRPRHTIATTGTKAPKSVDVDIDFDGIAGRVLGFPVDEGEYDALVALREARHVHALSAKRHQAGPA